jgi:tetratricopeptide (TPR) repeat protein
MFNQPEEALAHFDTALRLMPGAHLVWLIQIWRSLALGELGRWEEADTAIDDSMSLNPTQWQPHVIKALVCAHLGRDAEALEHIEAMKRPGVPPTAWANIFRTFNARSPNLAANLTTIGALVAAAEKGA